MLYVRCCQQKGCQSSGSFRLASGRLWDNATAALVRPCAHQQGPSSANHAAAYTHSRGQALMHISTRTCACVHAHANVHVHTPAHARTAHARAHTQSTHQRAHRWTDRQDNGQTEQVHNGMERQRQGWIDRGREGQADGHARTTPYAPPRIITC